MPGDVSVSARLDEVGGTGKTYKVDRYIAHIAATITIDCMALHMDDRDKVDRCITRAATITIVLHGSPYGRQLGRRMLEAAFVSPSPGTGKAPGSSND